MKNMNEQQWKAVTVLVSNLPLYLVQQPERISVYSTDTNQMNSKGQIKQNKDK